jgi:sarcosine oxidase/L-pipecolate oxidase
MENEAAIRQAFPPGAHVASFSNGYLNLDGGWAHASQGVSLMMEKVIALGGKVIAGKAAETLLRQDGKTTGVRCADGTVFHAQVVILAAGSWTASSFPELCLSEQCVATGYVSRLVISSAHGPVVPYSRQSIATIQLSSEETHNYRDCPVVLDFGSGFYVFPVNSSHVKMLHILKHF